MSLGAELKALFPGAVGAVRQDPPFEIVTVTDKGAIVSIASFLKASKGFNALMDLTAVDYLGYRSAPRAARFELVYYFFSFSRKARIRLLVPVPDSDAVVQSLTPLYGSANWLEREAWDMYGIRFAGHPDPRRLLLYEEFSGHPLRKDYALTRQQPRVAQIFPGVPPFGAKPAVLKPGEP
ncbi:MAG: NADH-quinone oxidoreductase subunit C [bacterium]